MLVFDTGIRTGQKTILNETEQKNKYVCRNGDEEQIYEQITEEVRQRVTDGAGTYATENEKLIFRNIRRGRIGGQTSPDQNNFFTEQ